MNRQIITRFILAIIAAALAVYSFNLPKPPGSVFSSGGSDYQSDSGDSWDSGGGNDYNSGDDWFDSGDYDSGGDWDDGGGWDTDSGDSGSW